MIVVKVPTAYIVPPHCAICRICSFGLLFGGRCGTFATGVEDTGPVGAAVANDGAANPARPTATAAADTPARPQYLKLLCPMAHPRFPGQVPAARMRRSVVRNPPKQRSASMT